MASSIESQVGLQTQVPEYSAIDTVATNFFQAGVILGSSLQQLRKWLTVAIILKNRRMIPTSLLKQMREVVDSILVQLGHIGRKLGIVRELHNAIIDIHFSCSRDYQNALASLLRWCSSSDRSTPKTGEPSILL